MRSSIIIVIMTLVFSIVYADTDTNDIDINKVNSYVQDIIKSVAESQFCDNLDEQAFNSAIEPFVTNSTTDINLSEAIQLIKAVPDKSQICIKSETDAEQNLPDSPQGCSLRKVSCTLCTYPGLRLCLYRWVGSWYCKFFPPFWGVESCRWGGLGIDLIDFGASIKNENTLSLTWTTGSEANVLGMNTWCAQINNDRIEKITKLNNKLIPSKAFSPNSGASYCSEDYPWMNIESIQGIQHCILEDIDTTGRCTLHCNDIDTVVIGDNNNISNTQLNDLKVRAIRLCNEHKQDGICLDKLLAR